MTYNRHTLDIISCNHIRQFVRVIPFIKLGAPNQRNMVPDKLAMEIPIGICRTVRGNQQIGILKIRRLYRCKFYLYRPLL